MLRFGLRYRTGTKNVHPRLRSDWLKATDRDSDEIWFSLRLMGAAAEKNVLRKSAERAKAAGLDPIRVPDHIPGSNGRYLDPIASLAWLAAATERIHLGTAVLIRPCCPTLPTAKDLAAV